MAIRKPTASARRKPGRPAAAAKKAVPARKAAPAAKPAPVKATPKPPVKAAPAERKPISKAPAQQTYTAHDVLRAFANAFRMFNVYWEEYGEVLDGAALHVGELAPPPKNGRPFKDGPARKALAKKPPVAGEYFDLDEVQQMGAVAIRELAAGLAERGLITETKIKKTIIEQMEEAGLFRETGDSDADEVDELDDEEVEDDDEEEFEDDEEDDEDDSDGDDDEDDGEEAYTLADLKNMDIEELQGLAEQLGIRWKNLTKASLINKIMETAEGDEEEPEDDEEEDDDAEELELDMDDIQNMSAAELVDILEKMQIAVPAKIKKNADALRDLLLENIDEDDEEE